MRPELLALCELAACYWMSASNLLQLLRLFTEEGPRARLVAALWPSVMDRWQPAAMAAMRVKGGMGGGLPVAGLSMAGTG